MGCVSSNLLNHDDEFTQLGTSAFTHHIVSLTSTTYGLLNLDPPSIHSSPPTRFTFASVFPTSSLSDPKSLMSETNSHRCEPEVIDSSELMKGLDADSFRFSILPPPKHSTIKDDTEKENSNPNPNHTNQMVELEHDVLRPWKSDIRRPSSMKMKNPLDKFEKLCPPSGENRVVLYTTTLRGIRKTFEECNTVRAAIESTGVQICERDVSMDRGFKEELKELMKGKDGEEVVPPRVFVKGRYIGNGDQVMRIVEDGLMGEILEDLPKIKVGSVCDGCGNARFLPCFQCNGSCKLVMTVKDDVMMIQKQCGKMKTMVVKCPDCNENGLVLCPICS